MRFDGKMVPFEDVAPPPETEAAPRAVADDGSIAGYLLASFNRAFRWRQAGIEDLGSVMPGGQNSIAESISIQGDVGGNTSIQLIPGNPFSFITQAWVWREKEVITFETIDGAVASELAAMNDVGQVIVATYDSDPGTDDVVVYIWQDGYAVPFLDLCDVPDHFVIAAPVSTNGVGDIGCSFYIGQGRFVSVILSPIGRPLGDVNIDCRVDERDLIEVLEDWGPDKHGHPGDMVSGDTFQPPGDGSIDAADLAIVLGNWTAKAARGTTR